jgi:cell fate regulator YaaT (PSP1 superfamily)
MPQLVKVRMRKPLRVFNFISNDLPLTRGDYCVVKTDRGLEYGQCILPPEECDKATEIRFPNRVLRKSSPHDDTTSSQIKEDEQRARRMCIDKIKSRSMDMKLVDCEYSFDRKKIIFYFTAEERVDFRDLVKDLAQEFKARIELRHIQVRDEAKIVGGIGTCGRELCCTTWMKDFMPISMKMAKKQNLALNPGKISGQCGRLMCCLSYENDLYVRGRIPGTSEKPKKKDLEDLRDNMEGNQEQAAEVLKDRASDAKTQQAKSDSQKTETPSDSNNEDNQSDRPKKRRRRRK